MPGESTHTIAEKRRFILKAVTRGLLALGGIIAIFLLGKRYGGSELMIWLSPLIDRPVLMYLLFLASETFIGIIPPEFYMIWSLEPQWGNYALKVLFLALISYRT